VKKITLIFAVLFVFAVFGRAEFVPDVNTEDQGVDIGRVLVEDEEPQVENIINDDIHAASVIKHSKIESGPAVNLDDMLEQVPGVYTGKAGMLNFGTGMFAASNLRIRGIGATPNSGILVVVDGIPRSMGVYNHPLFDALALGPDDSVEITKGPSGVMYGDMAVGGVINVTTKKAEIDGAKTTLGTMAGNHYTQDHFFSTVIKKEELDMSASANYSSTAGERVNSDSYEESAHGSMGYRLDDSWRAGAEGDYTSTRDFNPGPEGAFWSRNTEASELIQRDGNIFMENKLGDLSGRASVYTDSGSVKFLDSALDPGSESYSQYENDGVKLLEEWVAFPGNSTKFGFDYNYLSTCVNPAPAGSKINDGSYAPYMMFDQVVGIFGISAGFRYDIDSKWGNEAVPQAGLKVSLFDGQYIYVNASKGYKKPAPGELAYVNYDDLKPEDFWQYEAGISHNVGETVKYGVSFYQTEGSNILAQDAFGYIRNTGSVLFRGIDTDLSVKFLDNFAAGGTISYLDPRDKTAGQAALYGSLDLNGKFDGIGAGLRCGFAKDRFSADSRKEKLGDYAVLGADLSYKTKLFGTDDLFYLNFDNILNKKYYVKTGYPATGFDFKGGMTVKF
jgi:outer membrane cobalamin receptor